MLGSWSAQAAAATKITTRCPAGVPAASRPYPLRPPPPVCFGTQAGARSAYTHRLARLRPDRAVRGFRLLQALQAKLYTLSSFLVDELVLSPRVGFLRSVEATGRGHPGGFGPTKAGGDFSDTTFYCVTHDTTRRCPIRCDRVIHRVFFTLCRTCASLSPDHPLVLRRT